jgi:hypothetical protein
MEPRGGWPRILSYQSLIFLPLLADHERKGRRRGREALRKFQTREGVGEEGRVSKLLRRGLVKYLFTKKDFHYSFPSVTSLQGIFPQGLCS